MRIDWFWLEDYKNLKNLLIDFDEDHWITVLIGWNGTGKSNVIEALTTVFRDLVMGENVEGTKNRPGFCYKIRYSCRGNWIHIDADPKRKNAYEIRVSPIAKTQDTKEATSPVTGLEEAQGKSITISKLISSNSQLLPEYVFGYYSGGSDRLENIFRKYLSRYDKELRAGIDPGLKRLFYAMPVHSNFVLLSFIINNTELTNTFLRDRLGLEDGGIDSVLFVLHQPPWKSKEGDPRFWNAKGIVRDFLAKIYDISLAPLRLSQRVDKSLWNKKTVEFLYLYVKDLESLRKLARGKSPRDFFQNLESVYVSELMEEVRIRIKLRKNDGSVTFRELSEGEQQLLTVLGLLRFTSEEESLFLLDEPDTHLNPQWSVDYLKHLENFLSDEDGEQDSSHVILSTHNPLAVAELKKEQVQILKRDKDDQSITSHEPDTHPRGMGYAGVITSEMFGLDSALDSHTQKLLEEKRQLAAKDEPLTDEEKTQLGELNEQLEKYGFRYEVRDPVYTEYLKARYQAEKENVGSNAVSLSRLERQERAKSIVDVALKSVEGES